MRSACCAFASEQAPYANAIFAIDIAEQWKFEIKFARESRIAIDSDRN